MTDEELIARLREIQGQAGLFASAAADRIEALLKERDKIAALEPVAALTPTPLMTASHVNEPPKSEHDAGNVLTPDPAAIREAALREAAAILRREMERVDAIAPEKKATPYRYDQRKVSLSAVISEYGEIEREILALIEQQTPAPQGRGIPGGLHVPRDLPMEEE